MTTAQIIDLHRIRLPDGTPVSRALPSRRQRLGRERLRGRG